jgi:simple sugar transport system substrate-binding protein
MGINAAYIHAKKANPDVTFKIFWAFTWFEPQKEADGAKALIDQGCDVIMQHTDSTAAVAVAEEKGIFCFGQASDMAKFGPNSVLTSIIDNWGPYYTKRLQAVMDESWASTDTWDGIGEGGVVIAPISDKVPADVKGEAEAMIAAIADKSYHPFTGPLKKQDGSDFLAEGEVVDDGTLAGMSFYVEGIEGDIPS